MNVAGTAKSVSEARSRKTHRKFYRARVLAKLPSPNSKMCLQVGMQATVVACAYLNDLNRNKETGPISRGVRGDIISNRGAGNRDRM